MTCRNCITGPLNARKKQQDGPLHAAKKNIVYIHAGRAVLPATCVVPITKIFWLHDETGLRNDLDYFLWYSRSSVFIVNYFTMVLLIDNIIERAGLCTDCNDKYDAHHSRIYRYVTYCHHITVHLHLETFLHTLLEIFKLKYGVENTVDYQFINWVKANV